MSCLSIGPRLSCRTKGKSLCVTREIAMNLKRIALVASILLLGLASYFALPTQRGTDPAASLAGFLLFRAHCPMPEPTSPTHDPATTLGHLHLLQANVP